MLPFIVIRWATVTDQWSVCQDGCMAPEATVRRTQRERSEGTTRTLIKVAHQLFGERGFADVSSADIATAAGVSKGGMYHQFPSKAAIFEAVVREIEAGVGAQVSASLDADAVADPRLRIREALAVFLDAYDDAAVQRIVLVDGPAVLGWARWRSICIEQGAAALLDCLQLAQDHGLLVRPPSTAVVHLLLGALDEAVLYVASAPDRQAAVDDVLDSVLALVLR